MAKLLWAFCALGVWAVVVNGASHSHSHAPSPSVNCSIRTISKPEGSCCSGFKSVKENPKSLYEAFNNNNNLGVPLNTTIEHDQGHHPSSCMRGFYVLPHLANVAVSDLSY
ncbi:hypothetical protein CKAN_01745400 [Cinnamomum micranthum f. kanehirae]|uniref:Uncharacterized protein n=1 Tax=Cinnamomum micranthum f. kanehirae TaxID=337451 RepID=A0A3S3MRL5_9MAGN|nr:hypothetical protein CKAN_01745400 [Cinnamomum micranthum f. kanehirae]